MARIGEGDERWIVSERADGTNVGAWHWTEKDVSSWTKQRLGELLGGLQLFSDASGSAATLEVESVEGDSIINVRKVKLIATYELAVSVGYRGKAACADGEVHGALKLPYLSEENHDEDPDMQILVSTDVPGAAAVKQGIYANRKLVFERVAQFVRELRAGGPHAPGGGAGKAAAAQQQGGSGCSAAASSAGPQAATGMPATAPKAAAKPAPAPQPKVAMRDADDGATQSLELEERFYARPADIFEALTDERRLRAFTQSEATSQPAPGGAFSMYGGSVSGKFLEVDAPARLVQDWRMNSWPDGAVSKVTITLEEPDTGTTVLRLRQTGIPREDRFGNGDVKRSTEIGWREQILRKVKVVFGYGM